MQTCSAVLFLLHYVESTKYHQSTSLLKWGRERQSPFGLSSVTKVDRGGETTATDEPVDEPVELYLPGLLDAIISKKEMVRLLFFISFFDILFLTIFFDFLFINYE